MTMAIRFVRLRRLLRSEDYTPDTRAAIVDREVAQILADLPQQPEEDQQDIRAALSRLGLLQDRRDGLDRRARETPPPSVREQRSGRERRQERDLNRWLMTEEAG
jgi:hypothetical protein